MQSKCGTPTVKGLQGGSNEREARPEGPAVAAVVPRQPMAGAWAVALAVAVALVVAVQPRLPAAPQFFHHEEVRPDGSPLRDLNATHQPPAPQPLAPVAAARPAAPSAPPGAARPHGLLPPQPVAPGPTWHCPIFDPTASPSSHTREGADPSAPSIAPHTRLARSLPTNPCPHVNPGRVPHSEHLGPIVPSYRARSQKKKTRGFRNAGQLPPAAAPTS